MSFFKDFKEDFSQAVNELLPGEEPKTAETAGEEAAKEETSGINIGEMLDNIDMSQAEEVMQTPVEKETGAEAIAQPAEELVQPASILDTNINYTTMKGQEVTEETIITKGTNIKGDMDVAGSLILVGHVDGNVICNGKLSISGSIIGNTHAGEVFADSANIEGEIICDGAVKIGLNSVIKGNVSATSAVIAGAVNGDIDVQGPVIVDSSAVIMGNIKSRSVQINNGAVIEGFCSQCYADVNVRSFFEKNN